MPEKKIYSLSQLARSIQNVVETYCDRTVWLKAEIVKLNYYSKTGHCYPALVEKKNGKVIAELRGNIWSSNFERINQKFKEVLKEELKDDMSVVVQGHVTFHPVHGLALNIVDIDPEYTLGELAREKAATIERLKADNLFHSNKEVSLPVLPKTIAIISVETSKGYQDFLNVIEQNPQGYKFHLLLFPAILQGERAVSTITQQLRQIMLQTDIFDAVAIIRGGGGEIGLSSFDNYYLAREIANFPLPVLTGIGHSTNETVSEMVSFESFITPTKIAEFLLQKFNTFSSSIQQKEERLLEKTRNMFGNQKLVLKETGRLFGSLTSRAFERNHSLLRQHAVFLSSETRRMLQDQRQQLNQSLGQLNYSLKRQLQEERHHLDSVQQSLVSNYMKPIDRAKDSLGFTEEKMRMLSPENILKRGFSIVRQNGEILSDISKLDPEEAMEIELANGRFRSRIESLNNP